MSIDTLNEVWPTPYGQTPPKEWFEGPPEGFSFGSSPWISSEGRFTAPSHEYHRQHISKPGAWEAQGFMPLPSPTGNKIFHRGELTTSDGTIIKVGTVPFTGGHSKAAPSEIVQAMADYDDPSKQRIIGRAVETDEGLIICGAILPGTTVDEVAGMRRSALSGDWRWVEASGGMDFIGPCFVSVPGLPTGIETPTNTTTDDTFWNIVNSYQVTADAEGTVIMATATPVQTPPVQKAPIKTLDQVEDAIAALQQRKTEMVLAMAGEDGGSSGGSPQVVDQELVTKVTTLETEITRLAEAFVRLEAQISDVDDVDVPDIDDANVAA